MIYNPDDRASFVAFKKEQIQQIEHLLDLQFNSKSWRSMKKEIGEIVFEEWKKNGDLEDRTVASLLFALTGQFDRYKDLELIIPWYWLKQHKTEERPAQLIKSAEPTKKQIKRRWIKT